MGRKLRGLLSRWVSLGLNDLRSPPTLSNDSRDLCEGIICGIEKSIIPISIGIWREAQSGGVRELSS